MVQSRVWRLHNVREMVTFSNRMQAHSVALIYTMFANRLGDLDSERHHQGHLSRAC